MDLTPTDEQLLIASRRDAESFGLLFDRTQSDLFGYFMRRTADAQASADLAGEVFAAAFVGRRRFNAQGDGSARAWLFGIARRQLSRYVRRQQVSEKYRRKLGMPRIDASDDAAARIEALADLAAVREELRAALASLPQSQLDAVRLRVVDELPYAEVAQRLGCTEGAARVRVTRGLSRLAEVMSQ